MPVLEFELKHDLRRHRDAVHTLAVNLESRTLLSAGQEGILMVWNLQTGEIEQEIDQYFHGPISCVTWLFQNDNGPNSFAAGFADGTVHVYESSSANGPFQYVSMVRAHDGQVENMCWDGTHCRLATVGDGSIQVWCWTNRGPYNLLAMSCATEVRSGTLVSLVEKPPRKSLIARTVHFLDRGSSVMISYLESHEIHCYGIEPWTLKWTKVLPTRIGDTCLSDSGGFLFVSNLTNGVDKYALPTMERVDSFPHPIIRNAILQVAFAPAANLLVVGGDDGFLRVFDHRTGKIMHHVEHAESGFEVRTITCVEDEAGCILVSAGTARKKRCDVKIWTLDRKPAKVSGTHSDDRSPRPSPLELHSWIGVLARTMIHIVLSMLITLVLLYWVFSSSKELQPHLQVFVEHMYGGPLFTKTLSYDEIPAEWAAEWAADRAAHSDH
ncbi:WD40 repeat-like protein [Coniophora puteana RWD-64-598 SS2]|uniref:WD40 repeat-like protein n=1 Tax=Coniophora puteana (strain RWD-64-598) TaxID=741705 RepID=R7SDM6_CONPW|nr:WD40 repeat-like protein [Coniophora puteana RWD-64-598 SS2]EIW74268.1 WD40 repeat-like protein [Coniophora puteana RWD-64-598 SS2]